MKRIISIVALLGITLSACGNDQGDVADKFIEDAADAGIDLDDQCVRDLSADLSDEDVTSLEVGETPTPAAESVLTQMFIQCVSTEDLIDQMTTALPDGVDKECVVEAMQALTPEQLQDPTGPEVIAAMTECVSVGG